MRLRDLNSEQELQLKLLNEEYGEPDFASARELIVTLLLVFLVVIAIKIFC